MNDAVLDHFRAIADAMAGPEPRDWQWIGKHMSQRMFGITEARAKDYERRFGGKASREVKPDMSVENGKTPGERLLED